MYSPIAVGPVFNAENFVYWMSPTYAALSRRFDTPNRGRGHCWRTSRSRSASRPSRASKDFASVDGCGEFADDGQRFVGVLASARLAAACVVAAHIGSPNVLFDGTAGPYAVRVIVRPPEVVPGRAEVTVRVDASDVEHVVIRPVFWRAGVAGAPAGDDLRRIDGQERVYNGQLWLMAYGAYSVYVTVSGARGSGTAIVPVNSFATGRLPLSRGLGAILVVLGVLLAAGIVTIIRAASGESLVPPGEVLDAARRRRANLTTAIFVPILALIVFGGAKWWSAEDAGYRRFMYGSPGSRCHRRQRRRANPSPRAARHGDVSRALRPRCAGSRKDDASLSREPARHETLRAPPSSAD